MPAAAPVSLKLIGVSGHCGRIVEGYGVSYPPTHSKIVFSFEQSRDAFHLPRQKDSAVNTVSSKCALLASVMHERERSNR